MDSAVYAHVSRREIYPRHRTRLRKDGSPVCKHLRKNAAKDPDWKKHADKLRELFGCGCPIYARVLITHPITKEILKEHNGVLKGITTKQGAEELVESWFVDCISGRPKDAGKTVAEAVAYYIKEREDEIKRKAQHRYIGSEKDALESMRKYHDVLGPLVPFLKENHNIVSLRAVKTEMLSAYVLQRPGRKKKIDGVLVAAPKTELGLQKDQEFITSFFQRCVDLDWIDKTPAAALKTITVTKKSFVPLTPTERQKIIDIIPSVFSRSSAMMSAFVRLQNDTGMRLREIALARVEDLNGSGMWLTTMKGAEHKRIYHELKPQTIAALHATRTRSKDYFFWTGNSTLKTLVEDWGAKYRRLFKAAGIEEGRRSHFFRKTLGTGLRTAGRTEDAQVALGHSSTQHTEKSYITTTKEDFEVMNATKQKLWEVEARELGKMVGE
jgi:integrase